MVDVTRDPVLRALADARPTTSDPSATDAATLLAHLDAPLTGAHHLRVVGRVAAVAVFATAAIVSGLVLTSTPAAHPNRPAAVSFRTISYNTRRAMSEAASALIEYDQLVATTSAGTSVAHTDMWRYGTSIRGEMVDASGAPQIDISMAGTAAAGLIYVNYINDQYFTSTAATIPAILKLVDPSSLIRAELADGRLTEVGQSPLNGQPAIELEGTDTFTDPGQSPVPFAFAVRTGVGPGIYPIPDVTTGKGMSSAAGSTASIEWWVDPTTFLPMQQVITTAPGFTLTSTISWLTPTASALAELTAPIPSGFTQGPPSPR